MGQLCSSCFGNEEVRETQSIIRGASVSAAVKTPDPEERRRQLAEAAEKRLQEQEHRGIKNPDHVKRQQKRQEEMEKREEELARMGDTGPTMRWQVS